MNGHRLKNANDWDMVRHIMFSNYQAAGVKTRSVSDVLKIPLLDGLEYGGVSTRLLERIKQEKAKNV